MFGLIDLKLAGELSDQQKEEFPSWIKWSPEVNMGLNDQTTLKDSNGVVIGRMGYDTKHRLVPQFQPGLEVEPLYRPANFTGPNSYDKEFTISGTALDSSTESKEEFMPIISPVTSQESSTSSITSVGEIMVPDSNPRTE